MVDTNEGSKDRRSVRSSAAASVIFGPVPTDDGVSPHRASASEESIVIPQPKGQFYPAHVAGRRSFHPRGHDQVGVIRFIRCHGRGLAARRACTTTTRATGCWSAQRGEATLAFGLPFSGVTVDVETSGAGSVNQDVVDTRFVSACARAAHSYAGPADDRTPRPAGRPRSLEQLTKSLNAAHPEASTPPRARRNLFDELEQLEEKRRVPGIPPSTPRLSHVA